MSDAASSRIPLTRAKRVVAKLGTRVITHDDGTVALARLYALVESLSRMRRAGREVLIVSSGAVGLGVEKLGLERAPVALSERQACAAVGQSRLMALYEAGFAHLGVNVGQVLLTEADFDDRSRYLNLRNTLTTLLRQGVVPIINENDVVSVAELAFSEDSGPERPVFGDNDRLSALVASKLDADVLVLLTDVEGVYDRDPTVHAGARLLSRIEVDDPGAEQVVAADSLSGAGIGGMRTKWEAARLAARAGCQVVIASGRRHQVLDRIVAGEDIGTWFPARAGMSAQKRWIAWAAAPRGTLHLDAGAVAALRNRGASLLAAGVDRVEGSFQAGDVVVLKGPDGGEMGRGIVGCDAGTAQRWMAGERPETVRNHDALVHRDQLVLSPETADGS